MKKTYILNKELLKYEDVTLEVLQEKRKLEIILHSLIIIIFIFMTIVYSSRELMIEKIKNQEKQLKEQKQIIDNLESNNNFSFTLKNVEQYIDYLPFKNKSQVKAQMRLESANTYSKIARSHNNLYGMKNAGKRFQYGSKGEVYRYYPHWTLSVLDRFEFERNGGTLKNYAEDVNYMEKLNGAKRFK